VQHHSALHQSVFAVIVHLLFLDREYKKTDDKRHQCSDPDEVFNKVAQAHFHTFTSKFTFDDFVNGAVHLVLLGPCLAVWSFVTGHGYILSEMIAHTQISEFTGSDAKEEEVRVVAYGDDCLGKLTLTDGLSGMDSLSFHDVLVGGRQCPHEKKDLFHESGSFQKGTASHWLLDTSRSC